ncbi:MAG TPA: hypothetical protein VFQ43_14590 [Nitrososphaera sp.]|nr:hypothetical protein [Nitrososphaera sp.]
MLLMTELEQKNEHLAALDTFLGGPAHAGYKVGIQLEIDEVRKQIVNVEPITEVDRAEHFKLHGELRCLEQMLTGFEDARVTLKNRIDEIAERTIENATEQKK